MAQSALKTCEICVAASGTEYCIDCEQYFCDNCKISHKRIKVTRNHVFQSGSNTIQEVKLKCTEHDEDYIYICDNCDLPLCFKCVTGKHKGHTVSEIKESVSALKTKTRKEINSKSEVIKTSLNQTEQGLQMFDRNVMAVIKDITEEGTKMKAMIDRRIGEMVSSLKEKAKVEKEKLGQIIENTKQVFEKVKTLERKRDDLEKAREDSNLLHKLKTLNDEILTVLVTPTPAIPSVNYSPKTPSEKNITELIGEYSFRETEPKVPTRGDERSTQQRTTEKHGRLYSCRGCRNEEVLTEDEVKARPRHMILGSLKCRNCNEYGLRYVKNV